MGDPRCYNNKSHKDDEATGGMMNRAKKFFWNIVSKGVSLPDYKITEYTPIETINIPDIVVIHLQQHIGAPNYPLVKVGEEVKVGQKIGDSKSFVSAPVHASISGTVLAIKKEIHPSLGRGSTAILIRSDGKDQWVKGEKIRDLSEKTKEDLIKIIREAGVVGLGGAAFPTSVKLSPKDKIDTLIINGCECEPYITADHRSMLENGERIIKGAEIFTNILGAERTIIAIEANKPDAIAKMEDLVDKFGMEKMSISKLKTRYPQGFEKMLIKTVLNREVPLKVDGRPGLPANVGVVVQNVGTAKAAYDAVYEGKPLVERVLTVTGGVKEPKNLLIRVGTRFSSLIEACGGFRDEPGKMIMGGPMMGLCQINPRTPTIKGTNCLLVLGKETVKEEEETLCIRCGSCVEVCPVNLIPTDLARYARNRRFDLCEENYIGACMGCGACSYVCPSKIPIAQLIGWAKDEVGRRKNV